MADGGLATRYSIPSSRMSMANVNPIQSGNNVYMLNQTVNPAPGMNEERLADLASRKTLELIGQINNIRASKVGPGRLV